MFGENRRATQKVKVPARGPDQRPATRKVFGRMVARFTGMAKLDSGDKTDEEYLTLEFSGASKLHVPASHIDLVQKYVGGTKLAPKLAKIGGRAWEKQKQAVRDAVGNSLR